MSVLTVIVTVREPPQPGGVGGARAVLGQQWGGPTLSTRVHLHLGADFWARLDPGVFLTFMLEQYPELQQNWVPVQPVYTQARRTRSPGLRV